jgi:RNA polymerase sigma-70 factor (ECF subfamily)
MPRGAVGGSQVPAACATMAGMTHRARDPHGVEDVAGAPGEFGSLEPGSGGVSPGSAARARTADKAFERYVLPELDVLLRVAMSLTRSSADAEDLVQDTLLRAYGAVERFDGRYPRAWLLTIMRNAQVNRVRRRRPELLRDPEAGDRILETRTPHDSAEQDALRDAFDAAVESALEALPDKFRRVVRLVDLDGLSYKEAADLLGVPIGTVMSRLHRARKRIRSRLDEDGLFERSAG